MKHWKRVWGCAALMAAMMTMSVLAQTDGAAGGQQRTPMTAEERAERAAERAEIAKKATPLVGQAVAKYLELSDEAAKKFTAAYVEESAAAQKRSAAAPRDQDREARMALFTENSEKMAAVLKDNLTADQAEKATALLGGMRSLSGSIESLVRAKVEEKKIATASPILIKYALETQKLFADMRASGGGQDAFAGIRDKMTAIREKMTAEIKPIIGDEAAAALEASRGFGGFGGGGGPRPGGGGSQ